MDASSVSPFFCLFRSAKPSLTAEVGQVHRWRGFRPKAPVREGGPAGSGVSEATISAAPERPGGAVLGENKDRALLGYFAETRLRVSPAGFCPPLASLAAVGLPSVRSAHFGRRAAW